MNVLWLLLLAGGLVVALVQERVPAFTQGALDGATTAVTLSIGLVGTIALWSGLLKIAEEAGLVALLGRVVQPVLRRLFPEIPAGHPALAAMALNLGANALGLGNAATPLGLEAMKHLQALNGGRSTASNAMVLFLVINTASIQLVPSTVIALRSAAGAKNPADVIGPTLVASLAATTLAIVLAKLLERLPSFKLRPEA